MKPPEGMNAEAWLERCVEKTVGAPVDTQTRGTLLFALSTLGSLVHDLTFIQKLISEEMMQESPFTFIEQFSFEEHLRRENARKYLIPHILVELTSRFPSIDVQSVKQALESIHDYDRLVELHNRVNDTTSVEAFLQALYESKV